MWILLASVLTTLIKTWPLIQERVHTAKAAQRKDYRDRIQELEGQVRTCQEECAADKEELTGEIKKLHEEIFGLRKQHVQEQISFARAILDSLGRESPQLNILLRALENGQKTLDAQRNVQQLSGVEGDANTEGNQDG
jgi:hypothetical protein